MSKFTTKYANLHVNEKEGTRFIKLLGSLDGREASLKINEQDALLRPIFDWAKAALEKLDTTGTKLGNKENKQDKKGLPFHWVLEAGEDTTFSIPLKENSEGELVEGGIRIVGPNVTVRRAPPVALVIED